ncbi:MAG: translation initiation factor IF-2 [Lachnospiraceae bacterium]|nr:translation initiation factor IF-2 [Lachnospiraceae bacterium]
MSKIRIHELAKELGKSNKEVLDVLKNNKIEVTSHMSSLTDEQAVLVKGKITNNKVTAPAPVVSTPTANVPVAAEAEEPKKKSHIVQVFRPQNTQSGKRPVNSQGQNPGQNPAQSSAQNTTQSQGQSGTRPNSNYQGQRPNSNYQGNRPNSNYQGNRPNDGQRPISSNYQGTRPNSNYQGNRPNDGQAPRTEGGAPAGQRPISSNYQGTRPNSNYQGNRPNDGTRPSSNYQGQRPSSNYQGNRPNDGTRPSSNYQGQRPSSNYQGNRPNDGQRSDSAQGGQRPSSNYQGNRPNNNYQGNSGNYQGNNSNYQGNRPSNYQGNKPNNGQGQRNDNRNGESSIPAPVLEQKPQRKIIKDNYKKKTYHSGEDKEIKGKKKPGITMPVVKPQPKVEKVEEKIKMITLPEVLTIKELAEKMKIVPSVIVKKLFLQGKVVTVNQEVDYEAAEEIAMEFEVLCEKEIVIDVIEELLKEDEEDKSKMKKRPPVVCVMGHVDHGKTSLLDAIRDTNVIDREAGGITQHIGAYVATINGEKITFLDTPGHEAFTAMRMRGASSTDIAILVVAADDGVMPQTIEAINHAKAAGIEIIVAVNKMDKPSANIDRVKQELTEYELISEDWGGSTIFVPVSAKTKEGIEELMEMILLTAEVLELKANPSRSARGLVIEAELDKGKGSVATVLVQKGTLRVGDSIAAGSAYGKVRAMMDDKGKRVKEAGPSMPVEILGLNDVPNAGEVFVNCENDKEARNFAATFISQGRVKMLDETKSRMSLDDLFSQIKAGNVKELGIIVKADVQGSVEAVKQSLVKLSNEEVVIKIIHGGVGAINESDVILASASNAIIIGFNVRPDATAKETADREGVDMRLYRVIYNAIEDVEAAMKGMLDPVFEEKVLGHAEIRQTFKASGIGTIAGSYVLDGTFERGCSVRVTRDGIVIFDGPLASLKRFKDDVKEVKTGFECGFVFEKFNDVQEGDLVESYKMVEIPR